MAQEPRLVGPNGGDKKGSLEQGSPSSRLAAMTEIVDFTPQFVLALQIWLLAGAGAAIAIWVETFLAQTLPAYQFWGGTLLVPALLGLSLTLHLRRELANAVVIGGWISLAGFIYAGYGYAWLVGPWTQGYVIMTDLLWASLLFIYSAMFMGRHAKKVSVSHAIILTVLSLACLLRFKTAPETDTQLRLEMQPYFFTIIVSWAALVATHAITWLYKAMSDANKKAALLRGTILAMIGHELRTQMQAMFNQIELAQLMNAPTEEDVQKVNTMLDGLKRTVLQMQGVLENTSSAMKGKGLAGSPALEQCNATDVINEVIGHQGRYAKAKGLKILVDHSSAMPQKITVDRTRITQILHNLLSNSIKYSDKGCIRIKLTATGHHKCRLSVSDEGIGIAASEQSKVFKPFVRGTNERIGTVEGAGLGLTIVQREAEAMGGSVFLESLLGHGTTITIDFPAEVHSFISADRSPAGRRVLTVGMVALQPDVRATGNDVITNASTSQMALKALQDEEFDMIIFDLDDENTSPPWIPRELRFGDSLPRNRHCALVGATARVDCVVEGRAGTFDFIIEKPVSLSSAHLDSYMEPK